MIYVESALGFLLQFTMYVRISLCLMFSSQALQCSHEQHRLRDARLRVARCAEWPSIHDLTLADIEVALLNKRLASVTAIINWMEQRWDLVIHATNTSPKAVLLCFSIAVR